MSAQQQYVADEAYIPFVLPLRGEGESRPVLELVPDGAPVVRELADEEIIPRIGRVTADAVRRQHDALADCVQDMGNELARAAELCEAELQSVADEIARADELVAAIRQRGVDAMTRLENLAKGTARLAATCKTVQAEFEGL